VRCCIKIHRQLSIHLLTIR